MLKSITIEGFKSIAKLDALELGAVNVFIGANGSGKSNILEAVGVLGAAADGDVNDQSLLSRGVRPGTPGLFLTAFNNSDVTKYMSLSAEADFNKSKITYSVSLDYPGIGHRHSWRYKRESLTDNDNLIFDRKSQRDNGYENSDVIDLLGEAYLYSIRHSNHYAYALISPLTWYAIFSPATSVLRGISPDIQQRDPVGITGGRLAEAISDLSKAEKKFGSLDLDDVLELIDWVQAVDVTAPSRELLSGSVPTLNQVVRFTDRFMGEGRNQLTGYDASEGALYVLFLLTLAVHPSAPDFFAVDNFDQALNPRLARRLMRFFSETIVNSESDKQVLLTTHNPAVLDGLDLADDRIRLFAVDRNSKGHTTVTRITLSEKMRQAYGSEALSTLWVTGRLGAVPDL